MSALLTVGMPVFNGMPYLPQAVESLLAQTYRDFTLLVIDDGSTDGSAEYLRSLDDSRVKVYSQPHAGITATLNRMLQVADTPWLVRHDADDVAYPRRLEITADFIRKHPSAGMYYSEADYYSPRNRFGKFRTTKGSPSALRSITQSGYLLAICHPTVTLNVQKTRAIGGYRFDLFVEDIDLWWRMALAYDIQFIPQVLVGVRHNQTSTSWRNLEQQAVNTLYIQYLLLADRAEIAPRSYREVAPVLHRIIDRRRLRFRRYLRDMNIHLSSGLLWDTLRYCLWAFASSPTAFLRRMQYELYSRPNVCNGEDPAWLAKQFGEVWHLSSPVVKHDAVYASVELNLQ